MTIRIQKNPVPIVFKKKKEEMTNNVNKAAGIYSLVKV